MSDWIFDNGCVWSAYGPNPANTWRVALTSHASANTKASSYTEITAATTYHATRMMISITGSGSVLRDHLVDIAVGAAGSEVVLFPNLIYSAGSDTEWSCVYDFPCDIPAGTRLSARTQCSTGNTNSAIVVYTSSGAYGAPWRQGGVITAYGVNTATSAATARALDPRAAITTGVRRSGPSRSRSVVTTSRTCASRSLRGTTGMPRARSSSSIPGLPVPTPISKRPSVSTDMGMPEVFVATIVRGDSRRSSRS